MYELNYDAALTNRGNQYRIKELMKRAERGESLCIGFLGGSITMGSVATRPELCYAYHVFEWWQKTFPKSSFVYLNAGIGATDSQFGCARVEEDLLAGKPDFVIVEYSVNDESNAHFLETYEGVVRKIYDNEKSPAVMIVHNVCYDNGASAQLQHAKVARYYGIPAVSMQSTIYAEMLAGRIANRDITPDDLHPNDAGHELVASVITHALQNMYAHIDTAETVPGPTPAPMTVNAYQNSVRYRNENKDLANVRAAGFIADDTVQNHITEIFRKGWMACEKGATLEFDVKGTCIGVQYRKTKELPAPIAKLTIDGDEEKAYILDANFDETWGDKLVLETVLEHGNPGTHHIRIELVQTHPDDKLPFYVVSVIGSGE